MATKTMISFYRYLYLFDITQGGDECAEEPCPNYFGSIVVPNLFMIIYILITNVLLLNLLIALFSKTVDQIQIRSRALWQFERYDLVQVNDDDVVLRHTLPVFTGLGRCPIVNWDFAGAVSIFGPDALPVIHQ